MLNYHPDKRSLLHTGYTIEQAIEGLFSADLIEDERYGYVIETFHIHTDLYDIESRGIHYEFTWEK